MLGALIPCYDHGGTVTRVVEALAPSDLPVLLVDDGSGPATREALEGLAKRLPYVELLRFEQNRGKGAALKAGFRAAAARGWSAAIQLDADGQHDPAFLTSVLAPVLDGRCDVCIGSRYVARTGYRAPLHRRLGMLLFSGIVRLALGRRIADTTSGFRAYHREVMRVCQHDFPADFPDAPLLIALARRGFRLLEVPVEMRERRAGRSFYTLGKQLYYPYKNLVASLMAWLQRPA